MHPFHHNNCKNPILSMPIVTNPLLIKSGDNSLFLEIIAQQSYMDMNGLILFIPIEDGNDIGT